MSILERIINRPLLGLIAATPEELRTMRRGVITAVFTAITLAAVSQGTFRPLISNVAKFRLRVV